MRATVVAFDGLLADTLGLRAHALREACAAEGLDGTDVDIDTAIVGQTFAEAAEQIAQGHVDPTISELVALRAQRAYGALVAHGVPFRTEFVSAVRALAANGSRIVVRADSERRHVEPLLSLAGLEHVVGLLRCSDDLPSSAEPSLVRSWMAIDTRLARLGIPETQRTAAETSDACASVAARYVVRVAVGEMP